MDGNGRWAQQRNVSRSIGHAQGAEATVSAVQTSFKLGVRVVTLFVFSTENWQRPTIEVNGIMSLLEQFLHKYDEYFKREKIVLRTIGKREKLSQSLNQLLDTVGYQARSEENIGNCRVLCLALSYGGRDDIVSACKHILSDPEQVDALDEETFRRNTALGQVGLPDPDLVVRSSGESRISNFLLYNIAYSEIFITPTLCKKSTEIYQ
jgi:undecaprenyl diphosphate synthase